LPYRSQNIWSISPSPVNKTFSGDIYTTTPPNPAIVRCRTFSPLQHSSLTCVKIWCQQTVKFNIEILNPTCTNCQTTELLNWTRQNNLTALNQQLQFSLFSEKITLKIFSAQTLQVYFIRPNKISILVQWCCNSVTNSSLGYSPHRLFYILLSYF